MGGTWRDDGGTWPVSLTTQGWLSFHPAGSCRLPTMASPCHWSHISWIPPWALQEVGAGSFPGRWNFPQEPCPCFLNLWISPSSLTWGPPFEPRPCFGTQSMKGADLHPPSILESTQGNPSAVFGPEPAITHVCRGVWRGGRLLLLKAIDGRNFIMNYYKILLFRGQPVHFFW